MKPVIKDIKDYRSLDEIRQRKDEVLNELRQDNAQFSTLWNQIFVKRDETTKADYIASLVSNGIVAFDTFMLIRKLTKSYRYLFGGSKKKKKKNK
jgi:hypothetical protein